MTYRLVHVRYKDSNGGAKLVDMAITILNVDIVIITEFGH